MMGIVILSSTPGISRISYRESSQGSSPPPAANQRKSSKLHRSDNPPFRVSGIPTADPPRAILTRTPWIPPSGRLSQSTGTAPIRERKIRYCLYCPQTEIDTWTWTLGGNARPTSAWMGRTCMSQLTLPHLSKPSNSRVERAPQAPVNTQFSNKSTLWVCELAFDLCRGLLIRLYLLITLLALLPRSNDISSPPPIGVARVLIASDFGSGLRRWHVLT